MVRRFLRWWWDELSDMAPIRLRQMAWLGKFRFAVHVTDDGYCLKRLTWFGANRPKVLHTVERGQASEIIEKLTGCLSFFHHRQPVLVTVAPEACLKRGLPLPDVSRNRLLDIARIETARLIPDGKLDAFFGLDDQRDTPAPRHENVLYILKRSYLLEVLDQLSAKNALTADVAVTFNGVDFVPMSRIGIKTPRAAPAMVKQPLFLSALICAMTALGWLSVSLWSQHEQLSALEDQRQHYLKKARAARQEIDRLTKSKQSVESLVNRRRDQARLTGIWLEITKLLPDSAWVASLIWADGKIEIAGSAASASNLISRIEDSQLFTAARLTSPVIMDSVDKTERFRIEFRPLQTPATQ